MASTALQFRHARSGTPAHDALATSQIFASSRHFGWRGLVVEMGRIIDWQADELTMAGHFLAINLDDEPLVIENKGRHGFQTIVMPPGAMWINAAGDPFTRRNPGVTKWGGVELSVEMMQRLLGRDVAVTTRCSVVDEPLAALVRALLVETRSGGRSGGLYAEGVALALASLLARDDAATTDSAGHSALASRLDTVIDLVESRLSDDLSLIELARLAGVSAAHFAREFRRHTGHTPHTFVLHRRVERARQLLASGREIVDVAVACGFADQSHLTRIFKQQLGVTPGAFKNASRRRAR